MEIAEVLCSLGPGGAHVLLPFPATGMLHLNGISVSTAEKLRVCAVFSPSTYVEHTSVLSVDDVFRREGGAFEQWAGRRVRGARSIGGEVYESQLFL